MTALANDIVREQNTPRQLERLAAQRELYSRAKRVFGAGAIASVAAPAVLIALAAVFPAVKPWAALYGLVVAVVDLVVVDGWQRKLQRTAADIQEEFDCEVLRVPRNPIRQLAPVDPEVIKEAGDRYRAGDAELAGLRDWYPPAVQRLPLPLARLICQRTNLRWDAQLRRFYAGGLLALVIVLGIGALTLGLAGGMTVDALVLRVLAPMLPAVLWGSREFKRQREAAGDAERTKASVENLWAIAIRGTMDESTMGQNSRAIQDEIYNRRRRGPLVFDWVYERLLPKYEDHYRAGADDLIRTAEEAIAVAGHPAPVPVCPRAAPGHEDARAS